MTRTFPRIGLLVFVLSLLPVQVFPSCCKKDCDVPCTTTIKFYCPPPQGRFKARQLVGNQHLVHNHEDESWHGVFSVSTGYMRSFRDNDITRCLFGDDLVSRTDTSTSSECADTILIQGNAVTDRNPRAWFADYFYLPTDFDGSVTFSPRISSYVFDLDLYLNFDACLCGLYFRIYGPVVHTRWSLGLCESITEAGTVAHTEGYFSEGLIPREKLVSSFSSYAKGATVGALESTNIGTPTTPVLTADDALVFQPLKFARMSCTGLSETKFGDLRWELGWNAWQCEDYHIGVNVQAAAPIGTKRNSCFLFAPTVGNGRHWEVGAGITGHWRIYTNDNEDCGLSLVFDANVTHLFKARERRTFELRDKPNSAYMLVTKFGANGGNPNSNAVGADGGIGVPSKAANAQFDYEYAPLANITSLRVGVTIESMADITAMININFRCFTLDIGYAFWGHSREIIDPINPFCDTVCQTVVCESNTNSQWALKGDARMFGYVTGDITRLDEPVALSATQSLATIHSGTNLVQLDGTATDINPNIDNIQPGFANEITDPATDPPGELLNIPGGLGVEINTSFQPILLRFDDLEFVRVRRHSHKFFAHFSLSCERGSWNPYLGVGTFAEFGKKQSCTSEGEQVCRPAKVDCSLSQWGVWLKAGVAFC